MLMHTEPVKRFIKKISTITKKSMLMRMSTITQRMNKSDLKLIAVLEWTGGFASAQELHQILRREGDGIGLTTVYRALQSLVDDKIVDLLRREDGEAIYRLCGDNHHHHLVCKSCGDTVEIEGGAIEKWAKTMAEEFGFREVGHTAEIFGICSKCWFKLCRICDRARHKFQLPSKAYVDQHLARAHPWRQILRKPIAMARN